MDPRKIVLALLVPYGLWLVFAYDYHFIDGANLLFHEAGHIFFSPFGQTLMILGGTLGQLAFPVGTSVYFFARGRSFDGSVCALWAGENVMNVSRYMGDAQAMVLPRVGGEIHDWNWLLSRAGLLAQTDFLARLTHALGSVIVLGALVVAALSLRKNPDPLTSPKSRPEEVRPGPV
jgi:hypothetical protein